MNTNMETKINKLSLAEETNFGRRDFIKATGFAAVALGAGIGAGCASTQAPANTQASQPGGPYPANFKLKPWPTLSWWMAIRWRT